MSGLRSIRRSGELWWYRALLQAARTGSVAASFVIFSTHSVRAALLGWPTFAVVSFAVDTAVAGLRRFAGRNAGRS